MAFQNIRFAKPCKNCSGIVVFFCTVGSWCSFSWLPTIKLVPHFGIPVKSTFQNWQRRSEQLPELFYIQRTSLLLLFFYLAVFFSALLEVSVFLSIWYLTPSFLYRIGNRANSLIAVIYFSSPFQRHQQLGLHQSSCIMSLVKRLLLSLMSQIRDSSSETYRAYTEEIMTDEYPVLHT